MTDHPDDEYLVDLFLNGGCASFAIGVWNHLGRPADAGIEVLFDDDGEPNTEDGRSAVHAFWSDDTRKTDARGCRSDEAMADEYGLASYSSDGPYHPEEFLDVFCGPDGPFEYDPQTAAMAEDFLSRHPELIGIEDPSGVGTSIAIQDRIVP